MDRCAAAYAYHKQGYNCAQSVAGAFADLTGTAPEQLMAAMRGFGGGVGGSHEELCGAVSGGVLVLTAGIDVQDDRFELEFHYCPLVKAWEKQGCTDEEISNLCDWAMCGDRGIGEAYGCELDLPKTIARGDDVCHLIYHR